MNRTLKKVISVFLIMVMVFGSAPLTGFMGFELPELNLFVSKAEAGTRGGKCGSSAWWEYNSTTRVLTITGTGEISSYSWDNDKQSYNRPWEQYVSNIKQIVIDEGITTIGMEAFAKHKNVQTVQLPDSLEKLFFRAFYDCSSLNSITIPHNVISIGASSFGECSNLNSVILPDSLTSLYGGAFHNCTSLEYVTLSNNLTTLESNTFGGCSKLESIVIPESVTILKENVFSFCINLKDITLNNSVLQISDGAFDNCLNLSDVYYNGTYSDFSKISIGVNNKQLAYVTIHCSDRDSLGIFGSCGNELYWSFYGKSEIFSVSGNGSMNAYYPYTERPWNCYKDDVKQIIINDGVTDIGWNAFCYFYNLETIVIPVTVKQIDEKALYYLNRLTDIYYCGTEAQWNEIIVDENNDIFENVRIHYNTPTGKCGDSLTWIFDEVTGELTISGSGAMTNWSSYSAVPWHNYSRSMKKATICNGVTSIGENAFFCNDLVSVTIPDSVTIIVDSAFYFCNNLSSVTIPDSVINIGDMAFESCDSLKNVTIPNSVKSIGYRAFYKCDNITSLTIGNGVKNIGAQAFCSCQSLTNVTIPNSVTSIGNSAFGSCDNLQSITVDSANTTYSSDEYGVLFSKDKTKLIQYPVGNIRKSYAIPDCVTLVGGYSFEDCTNLTNLTIPDKVSAIGNNAFEDCYSLTTITIGNGVTKIVDYAFKNCYSLKDVYYIGTRTKWNRIAIGDNDNESLLNATIHYEHIHTVSIIEESVAPTCTEKGYRMGTCVCGYRFSEEVSALNHSYTLVQVEARTPTCSEIGWDAYEYCKVCNYTTYTEKCALNHDIIIDEAVDPTCTQTGLTEGQHCSRCDDMTIEQGVVSALNHKDTLVFVEAKVPTCTEIGWYAYEYCTACDYTTYVEEKLLGHDIIIDEVVEATCTETGLTEGQHCSRCNDVTIEQEVTPKLKHDMVVDEAVSPTCTQSGLTAGCHCKNCDEATIEQEPIASLGHVESSAVIENIKASACGQTGSYDSVIYCSACGDELSRETIIVDALTHQYGKTVTAPTCAEDGYTTYTCSLCGDTYVSDKVDALGHNIIIDKAVEATCTSAGLAEGQHCSRCDEVTLEQETIPQKNHNHIAKYDSVKHWKECICGSEIEIQNHNFDNNNTCYCGYKRMITATLSIKNNTGSKTINYGETLTLTAVVANKPDYARIVWYVNGDAKGEGETFSVSLQSGSAEVAVKLVDENEVVLLDSSGNEISDSENVSVKAGFFQKLISFFKNLFRISRIVIQSI